MRDDIVHVGSSEIICSKLGKGTVGLELTVLLEERQRPPLSLPGYTLSPIFVSCNSRQYIIR